MAVAARAQGVLTVAVADRNLLNGRQLSDVGMERANALTNLEFDGARSTAEARGLLLRRIGELTSMTSWAWPLTHPERQPMRWRRLHFLARLRLEVAAALNRQMGQIEK
jgi:hypothetical protein